MIDIKTIRKSRGYTQEKLAKKIGIKQQQYARYESGVTKIPVEMLEKILDICQYEMKIVKKNLSK